LRENHTIGCPIWESPHSQDREKEMECKEVWEKKRIIN
jgi:hypothetical protein